MNKVNSDVVCRYARFCTEATDEEKKNLEIVRRPPIITGFTQDLPRKFFLFLTQLRNV